MPCKKNVKKENSNPVAPIFTMQLQFKVHLKALWIVVPPSLGPCWASAFYRNTPSRIAKPLAASCQH